MTSRGPAGFAIAVSLAMGLAAGQVSIEPRQNTRAKDKTDQRDLPRTDLRADANLVLVPVEVSDLLNRPVNGLENPISACLMKESSRPSCPSPWKRIPSP
jgi:hypothetical protein